MGLLRGKSRKQYDPFLGRSGDVVQREHHETYYASFDQNVGAGTATATLLNVPANYYVRVLGITYFFDVGGTGINYANISYDTVKTYFLPLDVASAQDSIEYEYEQSPKVSSNISFEYSTPSGGTFNIAIRYSLEPTARGYLVNA